VQETVAGEVDQQKRNSPHLTKDIYCILPAYFSNSMATEIEHKYLIIAEAWKEVLPMKSVEIKQGYLLTDPDKTIRVRTKGEYGYITIKGKTSGASRLEFEYEIPLEDANELIRKFCSNLVEKVRHIVLHENKTWEVDEFKGLNEGLMIAEVELESEGEEYKVPQWASKNVTEDVRYANSNLALKPFTSW
jgi:adenylate cyclase